MKVQYDLDDILSLLMCAEVYEFGDDILYETLIKPLNVNVSQIENYIKDHYPIDKYSESDIEIYKSTLIDLFRIYK